jgi:hypothetical protein
MKARLHDHHDRLLTSKERCVLAALHCTSSEISMKVERQGVTEASVFSMIDQGLCCWETSVFQIDWLQGAICCYSCWLGAGNSKLP